MVLGGGAAVCVRVVCVSPESGNEGGMKLSFNGEYCGGW